LNSHGVSLHKYRYPTILFEIHEFGIVKDILRGDAFISLAGVDTHTVSFEVHISFVKQQILNK
jgi:hypothetical protein